MKTSLMASKPDYLICPLCEKGQLRPTGRGSMRCEPCGTHLHGDVLETLRCIAALPDTLGTHACECGHPEMRILPDGTYHCPACGSEVSPADVASTPTKSEEKGLAYWSGWADGCFGERSSFVDNPNLARWENPSDRLSYYRGYRMGTEARRAKGNSGPRPDYDASRREEHHLGLG
jgi:ribosomal protein L37AE/L43A